MLFALLLRRPPALEPTPPSPNSSFVHVGGIRLHYVVKGSGPALILLHGFGAWSYSWRKNIPALSKKFTVYAPDLKGFGLSDKPADSNYSIDAQAELISSFMKSQGIKSAVIAGNSLGGAVALRIYARHPQNVKALVLIDSAGYQEAPDKLLLSIPKPLRRLILDNIVLTKWQVESQLGECFANSSEINEQVVDNYFLPLETAGIESSALGLWNDLRLTDQTDAIRKIRIPTLIIWGAKDRILPVESASRFESDIPDANLVVVPGAGHACPEEAPSMVNQAISDFVTSVAKF